jgi:predicted dienelactone hydrolase
MLMSIAMAQGVSLTDAPPLAARGPHPVGVRTLRLTDAARSRSFTAEVWYPSAEPDETSFYDAVIGQVAVRIPGRAKRDAAPDEGPFPLIVASHGQPGTRYQLAYLCEHLASWGFVVASVEHTGSTYRDMTQQDYVTSLVYRPEDILFAIDAMPDQLPSADITKVGLLGYSYGGYSVVNAAGVGLDGDALADYCRASLGEGPCFALPFFSGVASLRGAGVIRADPRIKALFVMAPYGQPWFGAASLASLEAPLFVAAGDRDEVALYERDALEYYPPKTRCGSGAAPTTSPSTSPPPSSVAFCEATKRWEGI